MSEYNHRNDCLSDAYYKHIDAMTEEGLYSKTHIAAELAYRDERIAELEAEVKQLKLDAADVAVRLTDKLEQQQ